ncbi:lipase member H-like isoform X2 [Bacillus rossius redtenbacheri]
MDGVVFEHYSRKNPKRHRALNVHRETSLEHFDVSLPLKILIHGWLGTPSYLEFVKDTYLRAEDCNVVMVNWSKMSQNFNYKRSAGHTEMTGRATARLIDKLASRGQDLGNVHVVGHSLGGQTAGVVGGFVTAGQVAKITGLDPAGPAFADKDLKYKLDPSDGVLVEAIHTNHGFLGSSQLLGHFDFYPNGGKNQAGCTGDQMSAGGCNHMRAVEYFNESITTPFVGTKCDNYKSYKSGKCKNNPTAIMGEKMVMSEPGKYYFITNQEFPFAIV